MRRSFNVFSTASAEVVVCGGLTAKKPRRILKLEKRTFQECREIAQEIAEVVRLWTRCRKGQSAFAFSYQNSSRHHDNGPRSDD
jgi:hypothetical protein